MRQIINENRQFVDNHLGIPMYIISDNVIYDPPKLVSFLKEHKITRMMFTPSLLQTVLDTQTSSIVADGFKTMK